MAQRSLCKMGHPMAGDNVIISGKRRRCRTCLNNWTKANPHKNRIKVGKYRSKHLDECRARQRKYANKDIQAISDNYVRQNMVHGHGFDREFLSQNPEYVSAWRAYLRLKRATSKKQ